MTDSQGIHNKKSLLGSASAIWDIQLGGLLRWLNFFFRTLRINYLPIMVDFFFEIKIIKKNILDITYVLVSPRL